MSRGGPPAADPRRNPLTARAHVVELLRRHGLGPDKGFGQNFLVDPAALRTIVDAAEVGPRDTVLEVGPGLGVLTRELAARAARVVAVELDERLLPVLRETLAGAGEVEVVREDAVRFDYAASLPAHALLVANLPYNVATAVLARALASGRFDRMVVLVQREVAERLAAGPGEAAYGALSLLMAHHGRVRIVRHVPPGAFLPAPKVTSSVVRIDVDEHGPLPRALHDLIHVGFAHRRKTLLKNLHLAGYGRQDAAEALADLGLDPRVRAEALDLATFARLLERLGPSGGADPARP